MEKQLSQLEINKLFTFVQSKYVRYIDVQYELVDHLACEIETLINKDQDLSFDDALKVVYKTYPVTGFAHLVTAKTEAMNKYWSIHIWQYLKDYFKLPKIILTVFLFYFFFTAFGTLGEISIISFFVFVIFFGMIYFSSKMKSLKTKSGQYLVLESYKGKIVMGFLFYSYWPCHFFSFSNPGVLSENIYALALFSFFATFITIMIPALFDHFPKLLKKELDEKYAHLKITFA